MRRSIFYIAYIFSLYFIVVMPAKAQTIENMASYRMIDANRYVRLNADNDYFTATDDYYTQGFSLEVVHPVFDKFFLNKLLMVSKGARIQTGIAVEHNGYTPRSIEHYEILYGDRPFAASLMLKTFSMSIDSMRHRRITSALSLGVIGPAAAGYDIQTMVHQWIHYKIPRGWANQVQNDVVINYEAGIEKNILSIRNRILLNSSANARIGTLNTKLSAGATLMIGKINSGIMRAFSRNGPGGISTRRLRLHVYGQPLVNLIGYDATLQGGLFNKGSSYTLQSDEISRVTFQVNYGFVISFKAIYLEYFKAYISKEFQSGDHHRWGGIRVGVKL